MRISDFNHLEFSKAGEALLRCCGSQSWMQQVLKARPFNDLEELCQSARSAWGACGREDYLEAFSHHPRIGDGKGLKEKFASTASWASDEQKGTQEASEQVLGELAKLNQDYEMKFGHVFLICATGQTAVAMLTALKVRINNSPEEELKIAALEQAKITQLRLEKLFHVSSR